MEKNNALALTILVVLLAVFLLSAGNDLTGWAVAKKSSRLVQPALNLSMDSGPTTSMAEILRYQGVYAIKYSGKMNGAWKFSGENDYVSTSSTHLKKPDQFTIMLWVKPSSLSLLKRSHILWQGDLNAESNGQFAGDGWGPQHELHLSLGDETALNQYKKQALTFYFGDEKNNLKISTPIKFVNWQHVAVTVKNSKTGAKARMYFNGVLVGEDSTSGKISREGWKETSLQLGRAGKAGPAGDSDRYYEGMLDELAIYDMVLTAEEISRLCRQQNKGISCSGN